MPPLASGQVRSTDSLVEVVRLYERHGFPSQFAARPGGSVRCLACHRDHPARWMRLLALHRLEGPARPRDVAVAAVECPACEERGTLALAFGALAPIEDRLILSLLDTGSEESVVEPGMQVAS
ncbi:MAG: hypothetical protein ACYC2H_12950 [Thermoplasmatota archaeon]